LLLVCVKHRLSFTNLLLQRKTANAVEDKNSPDRLNAVIANYNFLKVPKGTLILQPMLFGILLFYSKKTKNCFRFFPIDARWQAFGLLKTRRALAIYLNKEII